MKCLRVLSSAHTRYAQERKERAENRKKGTKTTSDVENDARMGIACDRPMLQGPD